MVLAGENLREVLVMLVAVLIAFAWNSLQLPIFFLFWLFQRYPEYRWYSEQKTILQTPQQLIQYMVLEIQSSKFMAVIKIH